MGDESRTATSSQLISGDLRSDILRRITEEGGFAYVTSVESAAADGDLRAAEAAREMAWEQLHSGPWSEVGPAWRDAYAMACLHVASIRAAAGELAEAMRVLDMAIIMGGALLRGDLDAAVQRVKGMLMAAAAAAAAAREKGEAVEGFAMKKLDLQEVRGNLY